MKKWLPIILLSAIISLFCSCKNQNADNQNAGNGTMEHSTAGNIKANKEEDTEKEFNKEDYTEYLICTADGVKYTAGNNSDISTAIVTFNVGNALRIITSNGAFVPGNVAPQEISLQLPSFDRTMPKNYDISAGAPLQIDKLNGTDKHFITTTTQPEAIRITRIKDGYIYGNFECIANDKEDNAKSIVVTGGEFKILLKEKD